jgi:hypothetical protein
MNGEKTIAQSLSIRETASSADQEQSPIDYKQLLKQLTLRAARLLNVSRDYVIAGVGKSPADFAYETVEMFVLGDIAYRAADDPGGLLRYLSRIMGRDILDALKSSAHAKTKLMPSVAVTDEERDGGERSLDDLPAGNLDVTEEIQSQRYKNSVYELVANDAKLSEMAYAIFEVNAIDPRDIAGACNTTTADVQNRKKRFRRLLDKHGYGPKEAGSDEKETSKAN